MREREAEQERGRRRPPVRDWIVELGIGVGRPSPSSAPAIARPQAAGIAPPGDEAHRLLTSGLPACTHCRPAQPLGYW
ncbi:hypothetical protein ACFUIY_18640 [Streptomyces griseorubiginosus]|uniref:hypothetical protein n=1 Tax=Streptomyces griseorubiginosus TaxID=67304 RepID=UPI0036280D41